MTKTMRTSHIIKIKKNITLHHFEFWMLKKDGRISQDR